MKSRNSLLFFGISIFLIILCLSMCAQQPEILVNHETALIDQHIEISILHLKPHQEVVITATAYDHEQNKWNSWASYKADAQGIINFKNDFCLSGTYTGVDPMGLFWSMSSNDMHKPRFIINNKNNNMIKILLSVVFDNKIVCQKNIYRLLCTPNIERKEIRDNGIVGTIFYPQDQKNLPAVIIIPGARGKIQETSAQYLASHGYVVFALGYFGIDGLPAKFENIKLEYFQDAIRWLKQQPNVKNNTVALIGNSRGGEAALLLASTFPDEIQAVVATVPSCFMYGATSYPNKPAWTYNNQPLLPFIPSLKGGTELKTELEDYIYAMDQKIIPFHENTCNDPLERVDLFMARIDKYNAILDNATIPVEKITCPILIFSADDDRIWPSSLHCNVIMNRLDQKKSTIYRKHIHYKNAGHGLLTILYMPRTDHSVYNPDKSYWGKIGGTVHGNAIATEKTWQEILVFLAQNLN